METNIEKLAKEADLHLLMKVIESNCKTICNMTDGTIVLCDSHIETIHEISAKTLDIVNNYYKIEQEIKKME